MTKRTKSVARRSRRRSDPLTRFARVPRPRLSFDGQTIVSTLYTGQGAIGLTTAKFGGDYQVLDCSSGEGCNRAGIDVIKHYQEYKYLSCTVEWLPVIGPASSEAGCKVFMAYIDNPELIVAFKAATSDVKCTITRNTGNCKAFNAWERFSYRVPITYRRKMFNVDTTIAGATSEETDRAIQGMVIIGYQSIANTPAADSIGGFRIISKTWLRGFTASTVT